jgi:ANTAR domain
VARVAAAALLADGPSMQEAGQGPWSERAEVHQATGMVVAQLGVPETDALALLRAYAYSHDQSVAATARTVIARTLAFSANPDQEIEST